MSTETEFLAAYEKIKVAHKTVMQQIDEAIRFEELDKPIEAMKAYEDSLLSIENVFSIPVGLPEIIDNVEMEWRDACTMIQKLKAAKTELQYRLKVLKTQHLPIDNNAIEANEVALAESIVNAGCSSAENGEPTAKRKAEPTVLQDNPQTYYDIQNATGTAKTYREIIAGLRDLIATVDSDVVFDTLFESQVKLYKIQPNGEVATMAGSTSMSLVMCTVGGKWSYLNGVYFIQCAIPPEHTGISSSNGEAQNLIWIYPLIPTLSNCHRTDFGAFIFPDMESQAAGGAFGIILCEPTKTQTAQTVAEGEEELEDLQQFFLDLLEAVLKGKVEELEEPGTEPAPSGTSQKVSKSIVTAADFISRNLVWSAEKTGELMVKGTPYLMSKMQPAPPDAPPVPTTVQTTVEVAQKVTCAAAGFTGWVAGKVGSASMAVGRFLAPHIQTHGATLLEKGFGYDSTEANSKMEGALTIAAGAVEGFSTVYNGLEESAKILGHSLSENSVKIIEHKYGPSAGNVAAGTFDTLGNAFNVSQNVNYITPKGLAKKMAKNTGKAVVEDYKRSLRHEAHIVPAGLLYPDLRALKSISE